MKTIEKRAAKCRAIERHLLRVEAMLPREREALVPMSDASDAVTLHLWQAVQLCIDLAVQECVTRGLGSPQDYAGAFRALAGAGIVPAHVAERLVRAVGFRNVIAHGYEGLDLDALWAAAVEGPTDLRAFVAAIAKA